MENFKEFKGKDLDSAIEEACGYFNAAREKLEIEIVQDAKSGIFGIVGARKAKVRARRVQLREAVESILGKRGGGASSLELVLDKPDAADAAADRPAPRGKDDAPAAAEAESRRPEPLEQRNVQGDRRGRKAQEEMSRGVCASEDGETRVENIVEKPLEKRSERRRRSAGTGEKAAGRADSDKEGRTAGKEQHDGRPRSNGARTEEGHAAADAGRHSRPDALDALDEDFEAADEGLPVTPLEQLDAERLEALVKDTVRRLVRPIVDGEAAVEVRLGNGRVHVSIDCDEDSGLLIGREGQTLASLQYMISRIVSRGMNAAVRVQLDAGEYRHRQDEKLREMALALAEKVRQTGRSYSTRPLSSYHRRIVHVCLQDAPDVQTRSTGDGPMKRVVIMRKKGERA